MDIWLWAMFWRRIFANLPADVLELIRKYHGTFIFNSDTVYLLALLEE